jgi:oligogalacturonide transport system substrate-binding protein
MKRLLCILSLCAFVATSAIAADAEVRVAWWGANKRHEATLGTIDIFEKEHPGVVIKGEYAGFPGYLERMTLQIAAGSEPEMMQMNWAWLSVFSKDGTGFADLNNYKNIIDLTQYDKQWLDMTTIGGHLNAIPVSFTAPVFLLNKSTYDKAGVPLPKTWDDYIAAGKIFKEKLGDDYYPLDSLHTGHAYLLNSYIYQKTGH